MVLIPARILRLIQIPHPRPQVKINAEVGVVNYNPHQPIAVFLGPSLDRSSTVQLLVANYYPPARMGDIYRLLGSGVRLIVLIDGLFHQTASIWQRELQEALDNGILVIGASSMGALRAAELYPYGMLGYGTIFEWYRDGLIEGDDEVALYHADEALGFRPLSEPLVNIRYNLVQAVQQGYLALEQKAALIEVARSTYYAERSYPALLASPLVKSWPAETQAQLAQFLRCKAVNLKRQDALGVLTYCAAQIRQNQEILYSVADGSLSSGDDGQNREILHSVAAGRHQGRYYRLARYRQRGFFHPGGYLISGESLLAAAMKETELVNTLQPVLIKDYFLRLWAQQRQLACPPDYLARFKERWIETYVQSSEEAAMEARSVKVHFDTPPQPASSGSLRSTVGGLPLWLSANGLTEREFEGGLVQRALLAWLLEQGPSSFGLDFEPYERFVEAVSTSRIPQGGLTLLRVPLKINGRRNTQDDPNFSEHLSPPADFLSQAAEICFLDAWAKENGISCPPAYLEKFIKTWEETCLTGRRVAWLEAMELPETIYLAVLAGWATAAWLIEQKPPHFGYTSWSFEVALLKELQMTGQAAWLMEKISC